MAPKQAYLSFTWPAGDIDLLWNEAERYIDEELTRERMRDMVETLQEMGGGIYEGVAYGFDLEPGETPSESFRNSSERWMRSTLQTILSEFAADMHPLIGDSPTTRIDYDPQEWFADEPKRIGDYLSGRFFLLAYSGVLEALGFIDIQGTGLGTDPAS